MYHYAANLVYSSYLVRFIRSCDRIAGVIVNLLSSNAVDRWFEPRSGYIKDHELTVCCFYANHVVLSNTNKH